MQDIRCEAPHPTVPGWRCRARLAGVFPGAFEIQPRAGDVPRECIALVCPRRGCGAEYVACPVEHRAAA